MARTARDAFYTNNARTQIQCEFVDGQNVTRAVINKMGTNDEENPDWQWVHDQCGVDEIEKRTLHEMEKSSRVEEDNSQKQERMEAEALFNMKLKAFEIEEIRGSKNSKMKAKIRRADNPMTVNMYAAALIAMESMAVAEEPAPVNKAPAKKKAAPRKKAAPKKKTRIVDTLENDKREK